MAKFVVRENVLGTCDSCGRYTHIGPQNGFCRRCIEDAELENEHMDGYHDDDPRSDCPMCVESAIREVRQ